jgi:muramoyltetrapeptide carboxypeptidase
MSKDNNEKNKIERITRRNFLSLLGLSPFAAKLLAAEKSDFEFNLENTDFYQKENISQKNENFNDLISPNLIFPNPLKEGDLVAFTAPASPTSAGSIVNYVSFFKSKGCKTIIGDTIRKQKNEYRYLSAPDEFRAEELNNFFANPEVKAIICGRGGYGIMRILPLLDYEMIRKNPKIVMGYSDITALLLALYRKSNLISFHGPVASSKLTELHKKNITNLLFEQKNNPNIHNNSNIQNNKLKISIPEMKIVNAGVASGKLQGGNFTLISATMGTDYEIDLENSILFIEDVSILAHDFDRMFTQLAISNKLKKCNGILIGKMKNLEKRGNFYPNRAYTILELIEQLIKPLDIPCAYNLPFGHIESSLIFPVGSTATFDTKKKSIEIDTPYSLNN